MVDPAIDKRELRQQKFNLPQTQPLLPPSAPVSVQSLQEAQQKLRERQEKFGAPTDEGQRQLEQLQKRIEHMSNKHPRTHITQEAMLLQNKLYLYGTDFMDDKEVKKYFATMDEVQVQWLNDSSCTIEFSSEELAQKAYKTLATSDQDLLLEELKKEEGLDPRNFEEGVGWKQILGYQNWKGKRCQLSIRFATDADMKDPETKAADSRFYKYKNKQNQYKHHQKNPHYQNKHFQSHHHHSNNSSNSLFRSKGIQKDGKFRDRQKKSLLDDREEDDDVVDLGESRGILKKELLSELEKKEPFA